MTTPADKRIEEIAITACGSCACSEYSSPMDALSCDRVNDAYKLIKTALADPVILASVRDAALEEAAKHLDTVGGEESFYANYVMNYIKCAAAIRALKTAPNG